MLNANMRQRLSGIARSLFVAVLMFATLFPFYWTLLISLKNQSDAFQVPPDLIFMPTLENYEELFVTGSFGRYFFNSFVVCVLSIILALLVGIPSAYIFARCEFRFKKAFFYVLLITRMSPGAVFVIPYFIAYKDRGSFSVAPQEFARGRETPWLGRFAGLAFFNVSMKADERPQDLPVRCSTGGSTESGTERCGIARRRRTPGWRSCSSRGSRRCSSGP